MNPARGGWLILFSILVAMLLAIVHLPEAWPQWLGWLRPVWIALVVFFWVLEVPHRIGFISVWIIGLGIDVLQAEPLGLNGALLASLSYVAWRFHERLRMYSMLQQCALLFCMLAVLELVRGGAHEFANGNGWTPMTLLPPLISALVWPFLFVFLQQLRLRVRVE